MRSLMICLLAVCCFVAITVAANAQSQNECEKKTKNEMWAKATADNAMKKWTDAQAALRKAEAREDEVKGDIRRNNADMARAQAMGDNAKIQTLKETRAELDLDLAQAQDWVSKASDAVDSGLKEANEAYRKLNKAKAEKEAAKCKPDINPEKPKPSKRIAA